MAASGDLHEGLWHTIKKLEKEGRLPILIEKVTFYFLGIVRDKKTSVRIPNASIRIDNRNKDIKTSRIGEYWRLLLPGNYTVYVKAAGYRSVSRHVIVSGDEVKIENFSLVRNPRKSGYTGSDFKVYPNMLGYIVLIFFQQFFS